LTLEDLVLHVESGGLRLDLFLAGKVEGYSRAHLKGLIVRGCVQVDGVGREPDYKVQTGELVKVRWPRSSWADEPLERRVIHEDKHILVLDKPAGLLMHPLGESWEATPEAALMESEPNLAGLLLRQRPAIAASGAERCGLVHRLDRQTSGVVVVAKTPAAQQSLLEAFRARRVRKTYRALVLGAMPSTTVSAPVGRISGMRRISVNQWGREAETEFRAVSFRRGVSLVSAQPRTGRTHQIRAHLTAAGHPVLGDAEWFREKERKALGALRIASPPRMMLHAWRIRFAHPQSGKEVSFTAPLPKDFRDYWAALERKRP